MRRRVLRIPPLAVTVGFALLMWVVASVTPSLAVSRVVSLALTSVIATSAAVIGVLALREFRMARTSVNPMDLSRTDALVTDGVFRLTRNPMYVAMLLALLAFGCWLRSPAALVVALLFVPVITRVQIVPEEHVLAARFGSAFLAYRGAVRRWI